MLAVNRFAFFSFPNEIFWRFFFSYSKTDSDSAMMKLREKEKDKRLIKKSDAKNKLEKKRLFLLLLSEMRD